MLKKQISLLLSTAMVVSCLSETPSSYKTKSVPANVSASSTVADFSEKLNTLEPPKSASPPINSGNVQKKEDKFIINRDDLNYPPKDSFAPGMISIIYKNSYKISINKELNKLESPDQNAINSLSNILNKYKVIKLTSLFPDNANLNELKRIQTEASNKYNVDFPELASMHVYEFTDDIDTIKIAEELRKLPCVDTAYPTPVQGTSESTQRFVVTGFVYDKDKNLLSEVKVSIKFLNNQDKQGPYDTEYITDSSTGIITGMYFFRGIPDNTDVEISASKAGYKTVIRKENINSNKFLDPYYKINFGGEGDDAKYALEKE